MSRLILVCGSREYPNRHHVFDYIKTLDRKDIVISGLAPGPDAWAAIRASIRGLEVVECPADWTKHGTRAGFIRNSEMLDLHPQEVVAFYDGKSSGTLDTIVKALARDIPVRIFMAYPGVDGAVQVEPHELSIIRDEIRMRVLRMGRRRSTDGVFPPRLYAKLRRIVEGKPWVENTRPEFGG